MIRDRAERRGACAETIRTMVLTAALAALAAGAADAKTLKWGANREIASLDPYSYGDTFTLAVLNHVYEGLVRYNDKLKIEPALADVLGDCLADGLALQAAPGRQVPRRRAVHRRRRASPRSTRVSHPTSPLKGNLPAYKSRQEDRRPHGRHRGRPTPIRCCSTTSPTSTSSTRRGWSDEQRHAADRCRQGRRGLRRPTTPTAPARSRSKSRKPDAATVFVGQPELVGQAAA